MVNIKNEDLTNKIQSHRESILENIDKAKEMGVNKITAILVVSESEEEIQRELINWLIVGGYKVSLKREEYNILTIEW